MNDDDKNKFLVRGDTQPIISSPIRGGGDSSNSDASMLEVDERDDGARGRGLGFGSADMIDIDEIEEEDVERDFILPLSPTESQITARMK